MRFPAEHALFKGRPVAGFATVISAGLLDGQGLVKNQDTLAWLAFCESSIPDSSPVPLSDG